MGFPSIGNQKSLIKHVSPNSFPSPLRDSSSFPFHQLRANTLRHWELFECYKTETQKYQKVLRDLDVPFQCCQTEGFKTHRIAVIFHHMKEALTGNILAFQRKPKPRQLCHTNFYILKERLPIYYTTV